MSRTIKWLAIAGAIWIGVLVLRSGSFYTPPNSESSPKSYIDVVRAPPSDVTNGASGGANNAGSTPTTSGAVWTEKLNAARDAMAKCLLALSRPQSGPEREVEKVVRSYVDRCGSDYLTVWREGDSAPELSKSAAMTEAYQAMGCQYANPTQEDLQTSQPGDRLVTCVPQDAKSRDDRLDFKPRKIQYTKILQSIQNNILQCLHSYATVALYGGQRSREQVRDFIVNICGDNGYAQAIKTTNDSYGVETVPHIAQNYALAHADEQINLVMKHGP